MSDSRTRTFVVAAGEAVGWAITWTGLPQHLGVELRKVDQDELRLRGLTTLAVVPLLIAWPVAACILGVVAWNSPRFVEKRRGRRSEAEVAAQLTLAVELLAVSARAGSTVPRSVEIVGARVPGRVGRTLRRAGARLRAAEGVDATLTWIGQQLGEPADPLVAVLRSAYLDGEPLAPALSRLAVRLTERRRRQVEADARRLSVNLLIPLVCCLLPAFVLVAVVPVLADSLRVLAH